MKKIFSLFAMALLSMTMMAGDIKKVPVIGYIAENWSAIDTSYIQPSKYSFTVQAVQQNNEEILSMKTDDGMKVRVRSPWDANIGAGFFWSGLGYNYTFSLTHNKLMDGTKKTQMGLNIYSQLFNINIQYRKTGGDFQLKEMQTAKMGNLLDFNYAGQSFGDIFDFQNMAVGQDCRINMINVDFNYIWNHKKFSYPAAQSFGARQKRSAGSLITGLAYNHYNIKNNFADYQIISSMFKNTIDAQVKDPTATFQDLFNDEFKKAVKDDPQEFFGGKICSSLTFTDINLNIGYAYNWVPIRNVLLSGSVTLSPALKICKGDNEETTAMQMFSDKTGGKIKEWFKDCQAEYTAALSPQEIEQAYNKTAYSFNKTVFDVNASVRLAATWTNDRWFAGGQFVWQHYRYHTGLYTKFDNTFFTLNFTAGFKF